jgi:ribosome-dependent ATPase
MHAGKVLAVGTPEELRQGKGTANLENAFIAYLHEADPIGAADEASRAVWTTSTGARPLPTTGLRASLRRMWAFTYREMRELLRDWVRLSFALLGPLLLLLTFGYGITFDVENLSFAVLDRDHSADSRQLIENFDASRYFRQKAPLRNETEIDRRLLGSGRFIGMGFPSLWFQNISLGHHEGARFRRTLSQSSRPACFRSCLSRCGEPVANQTG